MHWGARSRKVKAERIAAFMGTPRYHVPCVVTITRVSPGTLDDDNLRGSLKAVRDGIADRLGCDDRDPRIVWEYGQERHKGYGVRIKIEPAGDAP